MNRDLKRTPYVEADAAPQSAAATSPENELQALYRRYAEQLPATIGDIEALWGKVSAGADPAPLKSLHRALHSLAGSGETFGYTQLGNSAKAMELALERYIGGAPIRSSARGKFAAMLQELKRAANTPDRPA